MVHSKEYLKILNNYEQLNLTNYVDGDETKLVIAKDYEQTQH